MAVGPERVLRPARVVNRDRTGPPRATTARRWVRRAGAGRIGRSRGSVLLGLAQGDEVAGGVGRLDEHAELVGLARQGLEILDALDRPDLLVLDHLGDQVSGLDAGRRRRAILL